MYCEDTTADTPSSCQITASPQSSLLWSDMKADEGQPQRGKRVYSSKFKICHPAELTRNYRKVLLRFLLFHICYQRKLLFSSIKLSRLTLCQVENKHFISFEVKIFQSSGLEKKEGEITCSTELAELQGEEPEIGAHVYWHTFSSEAELASNTHSQTEMMPKCYLLRDFRKNLLTPPKMSENECKKRKRV